MTVNPRIRALGETVLRVKDLPTVRRFYTETIGLEVLKEFDGITFLKVADGYVATHRSSDCFTSPCPRRSRRMPASRSVSPRHRFITSRSRSTGVISRSS